MALLSWKNTAENLIIALVAIIAGVGIGYYVSIKSAEAMLDNQKEIIVEAIRKETTSITNEFKTEIKKLKTRKGEVQFDVKPIIENQIDQDETNKYISPEEQNKTSNDSLKKRSFFGRLLSGKKYKNVKD